MSNTSNSPLTGQKPKKCKYKCLRIMANNIEHMILNMFPTVNLPFNIKKNFFMVYTIYLMNSKLNIYPRIREYIPLRLSNLQFFLIRLPTYDLIVLGYIVYNQSCLHMSTVYIKTILFIQLVGSSLAIATYRINLYGVK